MEQNILKRNKYLKLLLATSIFIAVVVLFPGCISTQLSMIREDISEVQRKLESIKQENQELNQRIMNVQIDLDKLQKEMMEGKISLEEAHNELAKIRKKLGLPAPTSPLAETKTKTPRTQSITEDLYKLAYENFKQRNYTQAIKEFQAFIEKFPESKLIDFAQFWLAECYYAQGDWFKAILVYKKLIRLYPFGSKVPDAYLKLGYCYLNQNEKSKALENFRLMSSVEANPQLLSDMEPCLAMNSVPIIHRPLPGGRNLKFQTFSNIF